MNQFASRLWPCRVELPHPHCGAIKIVDVDFNSSANYFDSTGKKFTAVPSGLNQATINDILATAEGKFYNWRSVSIRF